MSWALWCALYLAIGLVFGLFTEWVTWHRLRERLSAGPLAWIFLGWLPMLIFIIIVETIKATKRSTRP